MSFLRLAWSRIGYIFAAVVAVYLVAHAFEPARLNWGDPISDFNVMTSGRNFARYGFAKLHFTPLLIDKSVMTPRDSAMVYTHYPQLPDLANGVFRSLGVESLAMFRLIALAFTAGSLCFAFWLIRAYWGNGIAQIALAFWVINPLWVQHADYLHHGPYAFFFGFGALYFTWRSFARPSFAWLAGAFLLLAFLSSYDVWIFAPVLMAAMVWREHGIIWRGSAFRTLAIGAAGAVAAIVLKLATNAWALGGLSSMLHDVRYQVNERATTNVVRTAFNSAIIPTLYGRIEREFTLLFIGVIAFWAMWPLIKRGREIFAGPNPIILLIAAVPFLMIFRELWVAQYYPLLLLVPFWAVGTAMLIDRALAAERRSLRLAGALAALVVTYSSVQATVSFPRAFLDDATVASLQTQVPGLVPPGQRLITNLVVDAPYRYYLDRDIVPIMIHEPYRMATVMAIFTDPAHPEYAGPDGAVMVLHRNVHEAMFDKGYYPFLAPYKLWAAWAEPELYRRQIDSIIEVRNLTLERIAQTVGQKVFESDQLSLWRIPPATRWQIPPSMRNPRK